MAKRLTTEDHLAILKTWRDQPASDTNLAQLKSLLQTKRIHGLVVKRAAELALQWQAKNLLEALGAAAIGLNGDPENTKRDPGCEGKSTVLRTLIELEADIPHFFLAASRWIQNEGGIGKSTDTAAECRGLAAIGIAQTRAEGAVNRLVDLLTDAEPLTRLNAAVALGVWRGDEAIPLLRLKARTGDASADVLGEMFAALLRQDPRSETAFVLEFLEQAEPRIVEAAAMALGQTHSEEVLKPLDAAFARYQRHPIHTSLLMAIALLRTENSRHWFLEQLEKSSTGLTADLLDALRIYRGDSRMTDRIKSAIAKRPDALTIFKEIFGG